MRKRISWWRRVKPKRLLPKSEKAQRVAARCERKNAYQNALADVEKGLMEQATKLSETYKTKTVDKCYKELMQQSRITSTKHTPLAWNAFLCEEVRRRNDGSLMKILLYIHSNLAIDRTAPGRSPSESIILHYRHSHPMERDVQR